MLNENGYNLFKIHYEKKHCQITGRVWHFLKRKTGNHFKFAKCGCKKWWKKGIFSLFAKSWIRVSQSVAKLKQNGLFLFFLIKTVHTSKVKQIAES